MNIYDDFQDPPAESPPPQRRGPNKLLIGCLAVVVIMVGLGIAGFFYVKGKVVEFLATEIATYKNAEAAEGRQGITFGRSE